MSVSFHARGAPTIGKVELSNGSARIVLALLGREPHPEGWLEGSMTIRTAKQALQKLGKEDVAARAESAEPNSSVSAQALVNTVEELRRLVAEAEGKGVVRLVWR